jgi:hypothetical protein
MQQRMQEDKQDAIVSKQPLHRKFDPKPTLEIVAQAHLRRAL